MSLWSIDRDGNVIRNKVSPAEEKAMLLHSARVYLREAQARRGTRFSATLLAWAGNARREAAAIDVRPEQGSLAL